MNHNIYIYICIIEYIYIYYICDIKDMYLLYHIYNCMHGSYTIYLLSNCDIVILQTCNI